MEGEASGDRLVASFQRWAAAERAAGEAAARSRSASLARQAAGGATWTGILVDLAERSAVVALAVPGARLSGRLVGVGRDFCVLEPAGGRPAVVAAAWISSLAPAGPARAGTGAGAGAPGGSREPALDMGLASVMAALMDDRAPVVVSAAGQPHAGEVLAVGDDVVTIRAPAPQRRQVHIPLGAITHVELR